MAIDVTPQRIRATADLARLDLREDELAPLAAQLQRILGYIAELDTLDTSNTLPTSHVLDLACPLREDTLRMGVSRDEVLAQAPRSEASGFVVPQFVEG